MMMTIDHIKSAIAPTLDLIVLALHPAKVYWLRAIPITLHGVEQISPETRDTPKADMNLLVVLGEGTTSDHATEILDIITSNATQVWCAVVSQGAVIEGLKKADLFYAANCLSQNLLYEKDNKPYPTPDPFLLAHTRLHAWTEFLATHAKAEEFFSLAHQPTTTPCSVRPFLLHQSIELCIRAVLQALNGRSEKTHEIRVLTRHLRRCAPHLYELFSPDDPLIQKYLQPLDHAYAKSRYETHFKMADETITFLLQKSRALLDLSKRSVLQRVMT